MADSFADLWNSTAPTKPAPAPQKLGASISNSQQNAAHRTQYDAFSLFSSTGSSSTNSRSITPSTSNSQSKPTLPKASPALGGDAFSNLLSGSLVNANTENMTIAQKAALVEKQRTNIYLRKQEETRVQASAWAGLDSLGQVVKASSPSAVTQSPLGDDWGFGASVASKPSAAPAKKASVAPQDDDWGLDDFVSAPSKVAKPSCAKSSAPTSSQSLWDLDAFTAPVQPSTRPSPPAIREPTSRSNSPGDFDFGDREDRLLDNDSQDEDDLLGMLSKPVDKVPKRKSPISSNRPSATSSPQPHSRNGSRPVSPPPHIIGQIVEMGFSPQQARVALAATDTGLDVQAALETLLSNGAGAGSGYHSDEGDGEQDRRPNHALRSPPRDEEPPRRRQRPPPERTLSASTRDTPSPSGSQQDRNAQIQDQADKLIAQASEIGLSVFNRANAFWNQGKEKAQKLYEERAAAASKAGTPVDGRPRWMQDAVAADEETAAQKTNGKGAASGGFRDDDEVLPPRPSVTAAPSRQKTEERQPASQPKSIDLFSSEPVAYISPFRRGRGKPDAQPVPSSSKPTPPRARAPSPVALVQRQAPTASTSAIATSSKHKAIGTDKYKLGQFGDAEVGYSNAIDSLPGSHLLLIPLYNNRALARIKNGNSAGAVDDCTTVIEIIGASYNPSREAKVTRDECGASVDLGDSWIKAYKRRAEAWEGREKWENARKDWEILAGTGWAPGSARTEAVKGAGRCRQMAASNGEMAVKPKPEAAPRRPPPRRGPTPPSQALNKLRETTNAQEAEDQARHDLKDTIDAKLVSWKGGKETNIRALLASLDTVLWPELGWQKVGMAEVVTPSQVKIRYTKAIAKLHPDKLNAGNTTLEHRMIANGVFGALNEAWNAFKQ